MAKRKSNKSQKPDKTVVVDKYPFDPDNKEVYEPTPQELNTITMKTLLGRRPLTVVDYIELQHYFINTCGYKLDELKSLVFSQVLELSQRAFGRRLAESLPSRRHKKIQIEPETKLVKKQPVADLSRKDLLKGKRTPEGSLSLDSESTDKKLHPRISLKEANIRAREIYKKPSNRYIKARDLAKKISCSVGLISKLPVWKAVQEQLKQERIEKGRKDSKEIRLTNKMLTVTGTGKKDQVLINKLIVEQKADLQEDDHQAKLFLSNKKKPLTHD